MQQGVWLRQTGLTPRPLQALVGRKSTTGEKLAQFEFLRLSLSIPPSGDLDYNGMKREPEMSREEFLRKAFSRRRDFFHKGRLFAYVPHPDNSIDEDVICGWTGKRVEQEIQGGPEVFFAIGHQMRHLR